MASVELVFDADCPHVEAARDQLRRALVRLSLEEAWHEWRLDDRATPKRFARYGSPAILVNGRDVMGEPGAEGASCRIYPSPDGGIAPVPSVEQIAAALRGAGRGERRGRRLGWSLVPSVGVALLPKLACPACWPAYAGLLSGVGLSFLVDARWLLALTTLFLGLALAALAHRAMVRKKYGPLGLGLAAAGLVLWGKFALENPWFLALGIIGLISASLWNAWPQPRPQAPTCCQESAVALETEKETT